MNPDFHEQFESLRRSHRSLKRWIASLGTFLCLVVLLGAAPRNLLTNGSFETPDLEKVGSQTLTPSHTGLVGWKILANDVDSKIGDVDLLIGLGDNPEYPALHGKQCLDLNGGSPGGVSQDVRTVAGRRYTLTFASLCHVSKPRHLRVEASKSTIEFVIPPQDDWKIFEFTFLATGEDTSIVFRSLDTVAESGKPQDPASSGPFLDYVSLIELPMD